MSNSNQQNDQENGAGTESGVCTDDTDREAITERFDIDEEDNLYSELFQHAQELRTRGYSPSEIVPRLRRLADRYEDHFGGRDSWTEGPQDKDVTLPGDRDD